MSKFEASPDRIGAGEPRGSTLLKQQLRIINVGLEAFAAELSGQGVQVTHLQWSPPAGGNDRMASLLARLGM